MKEFLKKAWKFIRHGGLPISRRWHNPEYPGVSSRKYLCWNWLPKDCLKDGFKYRYWGYKEEWYDGPLPGVGFWYFHFYTLWY